MLNNRCNKAKKIYKEEQEKQNRITPNEYASLSQSNQTKKIHNQRNEKLANQITPNEYSSLSQSNKNKYTELESKYDNISSFYYPISYIKKEYLKELTLKKKQEKDKLIENIMMQAVKGPITIQQYNNLPINKQMLFNVYETKKIELREYPKTFIKKYNQLPTNK